MAKIKISELQEIESIESTDSYVPVDVNGKTYKLDINKYCNVIGVGKDIAEVDKGENLLNNGVITLDSSKNFTLDDTTISGSKNTTITGKFSIIFNGGKVTLQNLNFIGINSIQFNNCEQILVENCYFEDIVTCCLKATNSQNITFKNCKAINVGESLTGNDLNYLGGFCYLEDCNGININNCDLRYIYGQGALRLTDCTNIDLSYNIIDTVAFRGISIIDSEPGHTGLISKNKITNCGVIQRNASGVGCNGIYQTSVPTDVRVIDNYIEYVYENGIEGYFFIIDNNTIISTGMDPEGHPTPSYEGIYAQGGIVTKNTIINAHTCGIYYFSEYAIENKKILDNTIIKGETTADSFSAISLNSPVISNILVDGNSIVDYDYGIEFINNNDLTKTNLALRNSSNKILYKGNLYNLNLKYFDNTLYEGTLKSTNYSPFTMENATASGDSSLILTAVNTYRSRIFYDITPLCNKVVTMFVNANSTNKYRIRIVPFNSDNTLNNGASRIHNSISEGVCELSSTFTVAKGTKYRIYIEDISTTQENVFEIFNVSIKTIDN